MPLILLRRCIAWLQSIRSLFGAGTMSVFRRVISLSSCWPQFLQVKHQDEQTRQAASAAEVPLPTAPVLPFDVWDLVIDRLEDDWDYNTIRVCSTVCQRLRRRCKDCFPEAVYLHNREEIAYLSKLKARDWKGPERVWMRGGIRGAGRKPIPHVGAFAAMLARKWPRMDSLGISNAEWRTGDVHGDVFLHISAFTSIQDLHLSNVVFPSVLTFGRLVCALSGLKVLTCDALTFVQRQLHPSAFPQEIPRPALQTVRIDGCSFDGVASFLIASGLSTGLHTLNLQMDRALRDQHVHIMDIQALVDTTGSSFYGLAMHAYLGDPLPNVAKLTRLAHIDVHLNVSNQKDRYSLSPEFFSRMASYALYSFIVQFDIEQASNAEQVHAVLERLVRECCAPLDALFVLPPFVNLAQACFYAVIVPQYANYVDPHVWDEMMKAHMPLSYAQGILKTAMWFTPA